MTNGDIIMAKKTHIPPVKSILSLFLLTALLCSSGCGNSIAKLSEQTIPNRNNEVIQGEQVSSTEGLAVLRLTLPDTMNQDTAQASRFWEASNCVGGIVKLDYSLDSSESKLYFSDLEELMWQGLSHFEIKREEYISGGGIENDLFRLTVGSVQGDYAVVLFVKNDELYCMWFDKHNVSEDTIQWILQHLEFDRTTQEALTARYVDYTQEISEMVFRIKPTLPQGVVYQNTENDDGLYFQNDTLIGGHSVLEIETNTIKNAEQEPDVLATIVLEQVVQKHSNSDFTWTVVKQGPTTILFSNQAQEYYHVIIDAPNRDGFWYDIWFDTAFVSPDNALQYAIGATFVSQP